MGHQLTNLTDTTLIDSTRNWDTDALVGQYVIMLSGLCAGKSFLITHNTKTELFIDITFLFVTNCDFETGAAFPFYFKIQEPAQAGGWGRVDTGDFAHSGTYGAGIYNSPYRGAYLNVECLVSGLQTVGWWCKRVSGGTPFMRRSLFNIGIGIFDSAHYPIELWDEYYPLQTLGIWEYHSIDVSGWELSGIQTLSWYIGYAGGPGTAYKEMYFDDIFLDGIPLFNLYAYGLRINDSYKIFNPHALPEEFPPIWQVKIGSL